MDALNALSITTYDVDRKHGTEYNRRFLNYQYVRRTTSCDRAMTNPRATAPAATGRPIRQLPPDRFENRGIVVRQARPADRPVAPRGDRHRTIARGGGPGLRGLLRSAQRHGGHHSSLGRQSSDTRRRRPDGHRNVIFGGHRGPDRLRRRLRPVGAGLHVPEYAFASRLVELFASYHRQTYVRWGRDV